MSVETVADEFMMLFKRHLNSNSQAQLRWVTCKSVDWDAKTMEAEGMSDELAYYDVALGFGSCDVKPVVESDCIIGILEGQESVAWLIYASETELVEFNGGENGGHVKVKELTEKLNALKETVNDLVQKFNSHTHITTATVGATPTPGTIAATTTTAQLASAFNKSDFEDTKITH